MFRVVTIVDRDTLGHFLEDISKRGYKVVDVDLITEDEKKIRPRIEKEPKAPKEKKVRFPNKARIKGRPAVRDLVQQYLTENVPPNTKILVGEVIRHVTKLGFTDSTVYNVLRLLAEQDVIQKLSTGVYIMKQGEQKSPTQQPVLEDASV